MSGGSETIVNKSDPPAYILPQLRQASQATARMYRAGDLAPSPYEGARVAGFSDPTQASHIAMMDRASGGAPAIDAARGAVIDMAQGADGIYRNLDAVRQDALGAAVPAAAAIFSGSGMTNSTSAMDTVGRAATQAVAPIEYGAWNAAQDRRLAAAGMAPAIEQASYLPAMMMGRVGAAQDAMAQARIQADMAAHYERENQAAANLMAYNQALMGLGGMGGTQTQTAPGPSVGERVGSGLFGGAAMYGALAGTPYALPLAIGAGVAGML